MSNEVIADYHGSAVTASPVYLSTELRDMLETIARDNGFDYVYEDSIRYLLGLQCECNASTKLKPKI